MPTDPPDCGSLGFLRPKEILEAYRTVRARLKWEPENTDLIQLAVRLRQLWKSQGEDWLEPYDS